MSLLPRNRFMKEFTLSQLIGIGTAAVLLLSLLVYQLFFGV